MKTVVIKTNTRLSARKLEVRVPYTAQDWDLLETTEEAEMVARKLTARLILALRKVGRGVRPKEAYDNLMLPVCSQYHKLGTKDSEVTGLAQYHLQRLWDRRRGF